MRRTIAVAGSLAQRPGHGGHAWVFLQYLLGFKRLGWDVLFLDCLAKEMCVDATGHSCGFVESENRRYFLQVMEQFGLQGSFSLNYNHGEQVDGLPVASVLTLLQNDSVLINVMGFYSDDRILEAAGRRVFLDIDPGFGQMWQALNLCHMFQGHDHYVTIGSNIGRPECHIPNCGIEWITTRQPVVLEQWPVRSGRECTFTSIVSWRGPFGPIEYRGQRFGLRVHEFRQFLELPLRSNTTFELALDIHPDEQSDIQQLNLNQWKLVDPRNVSGSPNEYRHYIQNSGAEFMVAKEMYVKARTGWVSDRSICYLASGKPVLSQDTHLEHLYPTGNGLLVFSTLDQAVDGVENIVRNYQSHSIAAREIAEQFFDSDKVLTLLLSNLGVD